MKSLLISMRFFFHLIGGKVYLALFLLTTATFFEGVGIALFLPLLQNGPEGGDTISNMVVHFLDIFGLTYSTTLILIAMVVVFFIRALLLIIQKIYVASVVSNLRAMILSQVLEGYFQSNYSYFLSKKSGYILNAVSREIPMISASFTTLLTMISTVIISLVYISIPLILNPSAAIYLLVFGLIMFIVVIPINRYLKKLSLKYSKISAVLQNNVIQSLSFYKYLKSTNAFHPLLKKIKNNINETRKMQYLQDGVLNAVPNYGVEFLAFTAVISLIFYQSVVLKIDIELMIFIVFLLFRSLTLLLSLQMSYRKLISYTGSVSVYNDLMHGISNNKEYINTSGIKVGLQSNIDFENVDFKYKSSNKNLLNNINLHIEANSTVGIVGESGSGKSTLMSLLTGILEPTCGKLFFNDIAYDNYNINSIRSQIGYVTQESVIFNDTIANNITLWDENIDMSKVIKCAKQALAYDFIMEKPGQFEEYLGSDGVNLSGGQKQRIVIARELYKNSQLLIFDEATSALDSESESQIQKSILELKGKKTIIIITHRLFSLKNCGNIFLLKDGSVTDSGSFDELVRSSKTFKSMCKAQDL